MPVEHGGRCCGFERRIRISMSQKPEFLNPESNRLNIRYILNKSAQNDGHLIDMLLTNSATKDAFFVEAGTKVFLRDDFEHFVENMDRTGLYGFTTFGEMKEPALSIGNQRLSKRGEVVLIWPYKDCVLEGGQS